MRQRLLDSLACAVGAYDAGPVQVARALALMARTVVVEAPGLTALFPTYLANRLVVTLASGESLVREVRTGPGGPGQPMADADFEAKFRKMAAPHLAPAAQNEVIGFVATLDRQRDFAALFAAMAVGAGER